MIRTIMSSLIFLGTLCTSPFAQTAESKAAAPEAVSKKQADELSKELTATDIPNKGRLAQLTPTVPPEFKETPKGSGQYINQGCTTFRKLEMKDEETGKLNKDAIIFIPFSDVRAGQISVAKETIEGVARDVAAHVRQNGIGYIIVNGHASPCFDKKKSPFNEPFKALRVKDATGQKYLYVLTDGHHTVRGVTDAFKKEGGDLTGITIPIIPDVRFTEMEITDPEFWIKAVTAEKVYIGDLSETEQNAKNVSQPDSKGYLGNMTIDKIPPTEVMRGFIEKVKMGCPPYEGKPFDPAKMKYHKINKDKALTVWYSDQNTVPFVEYHLGKILRDYKFNYKPYQEITPEMIAQARRIFWIEENKRVRAGKPGLQKQLGIGILNSKQGIAPFEQRCEAFFEAEAKTAQKR